MVRYTKELPAQHSHLQMHVRINNHTRTHNIRLQVGGGYPAPLITEFLGPISVGMMLHVSFRRIAFGYRLAALAYKDA